MASLENLPQEPEGMASAVTDFLLELQRGDRKVLGQLGSLPGKDGTGYQEGELSIHRTPCDLDMVR